MSNLKAYCFFWRNPEMGITDPDGTTHWFPKMRVIITTSEKKARKLLKKSEDRFKETMRKQMRRSSKAAIEILFAEVTAKIEMTVSEYELKDGLIM